MMKRAVLLLLTVCVLLSCCDGSFWHGRVHRRVLIFADVTMSLASGQAAAVQTAVDAIVQNAPGNAEIVVVPVCENTQGVIEYHAMIPVATGFGRHDKEDAEKRRASIRAEVHAFLARMQTAPGRDSRYSSCISPALIVSKNAQVAHRDEPWITDAIFVSDMIEECRASILGVPVRLKNTNGEFARARQLAADARPLLNLGDTRVFVILPKSIETAALRDEPLPSELQAFWLRLFELGGVKSTHIFWDTTATDYAYYVQKRD